MSGAAAVSMLLVCGVVWGGFVGLLIRAARREGAKSRKGGSGDLM